MRYLLALGLLLLPLPACAAQPFNVRKLSIEFVDRVPVQDTMLACQYTEGGRVQCADLAEFLRRQFQRGP